MLQWTGIEINAERTRLEQEAACLLGLMVFEYSRLDIELGLMLAWSDEGRTLEQLTEKLVDDNFYTRLEFLKKVVASKYNDQAEIAKQYLAWLAAAHKLRGVRNELFHGRWGISPLEQQVVNVIGLPTSPEQRSVAYTIPDLQSILDEMRRLRTMLCSLREERLL